MKRSGKFYRKNEAEVMESLGLRPTKNSGSGWVEKEDGQSDEIICQLKSTDAESIKLHKKDFDVLNMLTEVAQYIETGEYIASDEFVGVDLSEHEDVKPTIKKVVKSSSNAREQFKREREQKFKKEKRSAT